ncbi:ROK family protein [Insolitispirillum peregrinum]|uniref:N-acetylglucosamine kinase n=1 Tax=Insolitispirillum peregrinum TaxID=80876 RepID=A0A1N7NFB6_9PROT|nr:ROK family protein [Insolitispirillum peregrinum]SIS96972.1 N-acetylglucosamine kinase [Insolitispirillum peregrinum]
MVALEQDRAPTVRYGVDLGGTKIEAIALSADDGHELGRQRIDSPRGDYAATVRCLRDLVHGLQGRFGAGSVGIGIPGTLSPQTGLVKNANSTWLIGHPFGADLGDALGQPVRLANDADCLALSEATDGAAAGSPIAFAVILGTGVGGGVVAHGRVLTGPNAIGGEWGHNALPWPQDDERPGPACYCGRAGCVETFLSGPGMAADHQRHSDSEVTAAAIASAAASGDPACQATLARYAHRLARGLASIINVLDPHTIVLGGGLSNIPMLYQQVPALWGQWVFSDQVLTELKQAHHGDSSGVRGAAWLWAQDSEQRLRLV